jgi:hypothetical protein
MRSALMTAVLGMCVGCGGGNSGPLVAPAGAPGPGTKEPTPKVIRDRAEYEKLVVGKTPNEITDVIGNPTRVALGEGNQLKSMRFEGISRDPATGRTDAAMVVHFKSEKAEKMTFEPQGGTGGADKKE